MNLLLPAGAPRSGHCFHDVRTDEEVAGSADKLVSTLMWHLPVGPMCRLAAPSCTHLSTARNLQPSSALPPATLCPLQPSVLPPATLRPLPAVRPTGGTRVMLFMIQTQTVTYPCLYPRRLLPFLSQPRPLQPLLTYGPDPLHSLHYFVLKVHSAHPSLSAAHADFFSPLASSAGCLSSHPLKPAICLRLIRLAASFVPLRCCLLCAPSAAALLLHMTQTTHFDHSRARKSYCSKHCSTSKHVDCHVQALGRFRYRADLGHTSNISKGFGLV